MLNVECSPKAEARRSSIQHSTFNIQHSTFVFLIALLIVGCSARPSDNKEHLEFWALGSEGEFVQKMMPEFERRNPNIHVVIQQIPWNAAHEKLLTAYVGESTPDVSLMGNTWMPEFVAIRALDDLGGLVGQSDYFPGIWATNVVGGTLYGIPWYVDTRVLFYRSDILAAVGFPHGPRTWAEWREAMTRIRDEKKSKWGILIPTNEYEPMTVLAFSAHSPLLNADGTRGAFSQPQFADAFNFYVSLFHDGFAPKVSSSRRGSSRCTSAVRGTSASSAAVCRRRCRTSGPPRRCRRATRASRRGFRWRAEGVWSSSAHRNTKRPRGN